MALALGYPDVDAMLDAISSRQWTEWQVFWHTYGFGERRMDGRFAELTALISNLVRDKDTPPITAADLLPDESGDEDEGGEDGENNAIDEAAVAAEIEEDKRIFEALLAEAMG